MGRRDWGKEWGTWADPGFSWGGGVQKIMCANAHYEHKTRSPFRQGSRACLRALEILGVFDALLCNLSLIFKHSDSNWDKRNIVNQIFLGGAYCAPPPPWIHHWGHMLSIKPVFIQGLLSSTTRVLFAPSVELFI